MQCTLNRVASSSTASRNMRIEFQKEAMLQPLSFAVFDSFLFQWNKKKCARYPPFILYIVSLWMAKPGSFFCDFSVCVSYFISSFCADARRDPPGWSMLSWKWVICDNTHSHTCTVHVLDFSSNRILGIIPLKEEYEAGKKDTILLIETGTWMSLCCCWCWSIRFLRFPVWQKVHLHM